MRRLLGITLLAIVAIFLSRLVLGQSRRAKTAEVVKAAEVVESSRGITPRNISKPAKPKSAGGIKPGDLFQPTKIWEVHLTFTPDQWQAMQPKQGPRGQREPGSRGVALLGPEGGRNGFLAATGMVFDYVHADLRFGEHAFNDVGVRYKGNGTFATSQRTLNAR